MINRRRALRRAAVSLTAASLVVGAISTAAQAAPTTIYVNPSQIGSTLGDFAVGGNQCPMVDGFDAWHFVAPGSSTFESITVNFSGAAVAKVAFLNDAKHAYVYTRHGLSAQLLSGVATINGSGSQFVLSHTCAGVDGDLVATNTATVASTSVENPTVADNATVSDMATVTSAAGFADAIGSVAFSYCWGESAYPTSCDSGTSLGSVTLSGGTDLTDGVATAELTGWTPTVAGYYLLHAVYEGDAETAELSTFGGSADDGTNETFYLAPTPDIATTTATVATPSNVSPVEGDGTTVTDVATVTAASGTVDPSGNVVFSYCYDAAVAPTTCEAGTSLGTVALDTDETADGIATASYTWTPTDGAGYYLMNARYEGTDGFAPSTDNGENELFQIGASVFVLRYGDIPRLIDTGSTAKCPSSSLGGRTVGRVRFDGISVPVKSTSYRRGGVFAPAPSAKIAGVSTRHQPLNATEGTTFIGWHVRYGAGCYGTLNPLIAKPVGYQFTTTDATGQATVWEITERHLINKGDQRRAWFTLNGPRQLVMATCAGFKNGKFRKNYVIIAKPVLVD